MAVAHGVVEPLAGELADRVEHLEPLAGAHHERAVHQRLQRVEHVAGHLLGGLQRPAAGEHRQVRERAPLALVQQVVAPLDRRPQRALALGRVARAAGQQVEPAAEALEDRRRGEQPRAGGGELDGERQAVEPPADLGDRGIAGVDVAGPADEQRGGGLGGERGQRDLVLARQAKGRLAGDEHRDGGLAREQRGHRRRGVHELLEVVQHHERLALHLQLLLEALAAVDGGQRHEPRAVAEVAGQPVRQLERQPRLADAARAHDRHEADRGVADQRRELGELGLAADQARGERRQRRRGGGRLGGGALGGLERGVLGEDRRLQPLQLGARLEPQLVDQRGAGAAVGVERVGLAARAVEGEHEVGVQALAVGMLADQRLQLGDRLPVAPEGEVELQPVLERGQPHALEPRALAGGAAEQLDVGQRQAPEQVEAGAQLRRGAFLVAGGAQAAGVVQVALEALEVQRPGRQLDRIAARPGHDRLALAELLPQLGDVHLQRLGGGGGRVVAPQLVDQAVRRDDAVAVLEQQDGEQRAPLGPGDGDLPAGARHPQRSQDPELHRLTSTLPPACRWSRTCRPCTSTTTSGRRATVIAKRATWT